MKTKPVLLFVDAAVRPPELSRTARLCKIYLDMFGRIHPGYEIQRISLINEAFTSTTWEEVQQRENPAACNDPDLPLLRYARQFAAADRIVIGAPYWDLSFPAILKQYIEKVCVLNVTFAYGEKGIIPRCRAQRLTYLTACGGKLPELPHGAAYFQDLCKTLFGIPDFEWAGAELLDIAGNDPEALMTEAEKRVMRLAERP